MGLRVSQATAGRQDNVRQNNKTIKIMVTAVVVIQGKKNNDNRKIFNNTN
jgi:hypothetical protein